MLGMFNPHKQLKSIASLLKTKPAQVTAGTVGLALVNNPASLAIVGGCVVASYAISSGRVRRLAFESGPLRLAVEFEDEPDDSSRPRLELT